MEQMGQNQRICTFCDKTCIFFDSAPFAPLCENIHDIIHKTGST